MPESAQEWAGAATHSPKSTFWTARWCSVSAVGSWEQPVRCSTGCSVHAMSILQGHDCSRDMGYTTGVRQVLGHEQRNLALKFMGIRYIHVEATGNTVRRKLR